MIKRQKSMSAELRNIESNRRAEPEKDHFTGSVFLYFPAFPVTVLRG